MTTWLLTGGAGYIGAHVIRSLQASGRNVVVLDDLSTGVQFKVPDDVPFIRASVHDVGPVTNALMEHKVTGVVHLAAKKAVGESMESPIFYYHQNVSGLVNLLQAMHYASVQHIVYSSSAAVYGDVAGEWITEDSPTQPTSPYGETKLIGEWLVRDDSRIRGRSWIALRYFNVAGAAADHLGDTSVNNLIPMVFRALEERGAPQVFGTDYPTPDGSCIRDYIHVQDLADAHAAAADACEMGGAADILNVGTGQGTSVWEVMRTVSEVLDRDIGAVAAPRRPGDPARIVASPDLIKRKLDWQASRDLRDMVASSWSAWQAFPGD
jgi:UDP-glucose 4-epimerase